LDLNPWALRRDYYDTVVGENKIDNDKNEGKLLAILIAMALQRYNTGHVAQ